MEREEKTWEGREKVAEFLFDGNKEKAQQLLTLMESFVSPTVPPEFKRTMIIPEDDCKWCIGGECLMYMPDSMFLCTGKCSDYKGRNSA